MLNAVAGNSREAWAGVRVDMDVCVGGCGDEALRAGEAGVGLGLVQRAKMILIFYYFAWLGCEWIGGKTREILNGSLCLIMAKGRIGDC